MQVAEIGRVFESGHAEPMRGGAIAQHWMAYMRDMLGVQSRKDRAVAIHVRDDRGQLTIYRPRA